MASGLIIVGVSIIISAVISAYAIFQGRKGNDGSLDPSTDFNPAHTKEGTVFPIGYGRFRTKAGLIFNGNIKTVEIKSSSGGGKGSGGSSEQVTGHKFFSDAWFTLAKGKVSLITIFQDDKEKPLSEFSADFTIFNDGTQTTFPSTFKDNTGSPLEFAAHLNPIAHFSLGNWFMAENRGTMPNLEFILERDLSALSINSPNLPNGSNPAAVVMDILLDNNITLANIDTTSFNAAADFFAAQEFGINILFDKQITAGKMIEEIQGYVDFVLRRDELGRYVIKAIDRDDVFVEFITEQDMNDFSINRKSWRQTHNNFIGVYNSEADGFKQRTVISNNPAAILLANRTINRSVDLKAFRDEETASKRIVEIMKRSSYPIATIRIKTNWKFANVLPGDIIRVSHSDYGIVSADFRVTKVDTNNLASNEIIIDAEQQVETLQDDEFNLSGSSRYSSTKQDLTLTALTHVHAFELPFNNITDNNRNNWIILAAREKLIETNFLALVSNNPTSNFQTLGQFTTFAMRGTLDLAYPNTTFQVDDEVGILFTYFNNDPVFTTIARAQMYAVPRFVFINNEMMTFEKFTPQAGNQVLLEGVTRKLYGTPKESHALNDEIWISFLSENVLDNIPFNDFYIKILPMFISKVLDPSLVTAINFVKTNKELNPRNVGRIQATKAAGNVTFQLHPSTPGIVGAGDVDESFTDAGPPFEFEGDFELTGDVSPSPQIQVLDSFVIAPTGFPANITIKTRLNNKISSGRLITVGTTDGVYYG